MRKMMFAAGLGLLLSACASVTKPEIDKPMVVKARHVAITGFHVAMQEPKSVIGDLQKLGDLTKGKVRDANEEHDTADEIYDELSRRLRGDMGWSMESAASLEHSAQYQALVKKYTTGLQIGGTPVGENYHKIRPHNVLDADPFIGKISQADREALMDDLRVDALVADFLIVSLSNESMFGGMIGRAKYKPKAQNIIRVFVRGRKDPVWFDTWAWGEGDQALQAELNFVEDKPLLEQVVVASKKSIGETLQRYKSL
jgi:hypothetical protein